MKFFSKVSSLTIITALTMAVVACSSARTRVPVEEIDITKTATPIPRANPGFLQYLEKKSLLGNAAGIAKIVSGSRLGWQGTGRGDDIDQFLQHANVWISLNPYTLVLEARRTTFDFLTESRFWSVMRDIGVKGIYIAPTSGTTRLWSKGSNSNSPDTGEGVVQYDFSDTAGSERSYGYMMNKVMDEKASIGSDLIPGATGIGPDFFLAERNIRDYPGAYCLVEIPKELWEILPAVTDEWQGVALSTQAVSTLHQKGILPPSMVRDLTVGGAKIGWAATSQVTGADGNKKRWIYRYFKDPSCAILNWEDPSRAAARIMSGSVVNQVGILGQELIGMNFEAFRGLEASGGTSTALSAAQSLHGEIKRYGAQSWLKDRDITLQDMSQALNSGTVFISDNALSPGSEHALMTGDAELLRYMADKLISSSIETKHLVHTMPSYNGISYSLSTLKQEALHGDKKASNLLESVLSQLSQAVSNQEYMPVKKQVLYTTSTELATMGIKNFNSSAKNISKGEIAKGHSLLVFFKAMQPGLVMLSGQDLVGTLPVKPRDMPNRSEWDTSYSSRGSYSLTSSNGLFVHNEQGIPSAKTLYEPAEVQVMDKGSFLHKIGLFLRKRSEIGMANGHLIARPITKGKGSIALTTRLSSGSYVLAICNFSRTPITENIDISAIPQTANNSPIAGDGKYTLYGTTLTVTLGPWQAKSILFGGSLKKHTSSKQSTTVEQVAPIVDPAQGMYPDEQQAVSPKKIF